MITIIMETPIHIRDLSDPGDQVLRKFRYQHAYGVILAIAMATREKDYVAIWCEQHEDILAETEGGHFDAYQVKTRKSELGEWELNDEDFYKSVRRFVSLDRKFPRTIRFFRFVSNTNYSDTNSERRIHLSPRKLIAAVKSVNSSKKLAGSALKGFDALKADADVDDAALFSVLQKLDLIVGPTERAFEAELYTRHIPTLSRDITESCV